MMPEPLHRLFLAGPCRECFVLVKSGQLDRTHFFMDLLHPQLFSATNAPQNRHSSGLGSP